MIKNQQDPVNKKRKSHEQTNILIEKDLIVKKSYDGVEDHTVDCLRCDKVLERVSVACEVFTAGGVFKGRLAGWFEKNSIIVSETNESKQVVD